MMQRLLDSKFWRERTAREQRLLSAGSAVLLLIVLLLGLIEPALEGRQDWQGALPQLRAERAQMQSFAEQLGSAASPAARESRPIDRATLERSLTDAGIKPASLELSNGLIRARWNDVSFSALNRWLLQMQREQALSVIEANISARERVDRVDATVSLRSLRSAP
jgi:type II secretory pathway component PulM